MEEVGLSNQLKIAVLHQTRVETNTQLVSNRDSFTSIEILEIKDAMKPENVASPENTSNGSGKVKYDPTYGELYEAVRTGDLESTKRLLNENPEAVTERISIEGMLPLHVAVLFEHKEIVNELLGRMSKDDVKLTYDGKITALNEATYGSIEVAKCLVEKNSDLLTIAKENGGLIPVTRAFGVGQIEMGRYLYSVTPKEVFAPDYGTHGATLLNMCYYRGLLDIALDLLDHWPSLAVTPDNHGTTFLEILASMPSKFPSGCDFSFLQRWMYNRIDIKEEQLRASHQNVQHETSQPTYANNEISVNMPETRPTRSDNTSSTNKESNNNTKVSCGKGKGPWESLKFLLTELFITRNWLMTDRKRIYEIKLEHERARELLRIACKELSTLDDEQLETSRARVAVVEAAKKGVPEFITEVVKVHFQLFWVGQNRKTPMHVAVQYRQAKVFNLIHGMNWKNTIANLRDENGKCLLHMAAEFDPSKNLHDNVYGAALQMQRELQWFKKVESITPPWRINEPVKQDDDIFKTPRQLFTDTHKELMKQGEKWMKGTATSCSVVAALVATIVFAAAFTVPGGNDQDTGYPIFSKKKGFMVFILSDAVSLFSSSTSILMFLRILTTRYAEDHFLKSLPKSLIIGLLALFISMASMLTAFCAALFIMLRGELWIVIPVSIIVAAPFLAFCVYQSPLLYEMTKSTYWPNIFDGNDKKWVTAKRGDINKHYM